MFEHIEQRLADAVGRRPRGKALRRFDARASEGAGYDAHGRGFIVLPASA
jgi:hypothetical protein